MVGTSDTAATTQALTICVFHIALDEPTTSMEPFRTYKHQF